MILWSILDLDGMCEVDSPSAFHWLLLQKEKNRLRKPSRINKGEESADAAYMKNCIAYF